MKKSTIILIAILGILAIWCVSGYNGMVSTDEDANKSWGNVQSAYQRRADLIPSLVETVKGYAKHEEETFKGVIEARSKATQVTQNITEPTEENMKQLQAAQGDLSNALSRLMVVVEAYPELKANENFMDLQSQLEGTENRINEARRDYNEKVLTYNVKVRKFPNNILAGIFGFSTKAMFAADEGAQKAPEVKF